MSKFHAPLTILFTVLVLIGFGCSSRTDQRAASRPADTTIAAAPADSLVITMIAPDSTTVFDLLRRTHRVDARSTALGVFVRAIDSIPSGGGASWVFSVNDSVPMVAADRCEVVPGDTVRWYFRRSSP